MALRSFRNRVARDAELQGYPLSQVQRANRRRLLVFLATLIVALAFSLSYVFMRPAEYRATARVEITPPAELPPLAGSAGAAAGESPRSFLTEVQVLSSRPLLEAVVDDLRKTGHDVSSLGGDPVTTVQSRLQITPVSRTNVAELVATGPTAELLAPLLNGIVEAYRRRMAEAYRSSSSEALAAADDEVKKLEADVVAKRRDVEAFRLRNNIVSLERDENEILSRVRNLGASLRNANERVAIAEGKLRSMKEAAAAGRAVVRARDDPTLANLEQRASQVREELSNVGKTYTPDYMAMDPRVKDMRARLAELERQIAAQRAASGQVAVNEAQEELASAQEAARRTAIQIAEGQQEARQFTTKYNEYKSRQEELTQLEGLYRDATQRKTRLEATERARTPALKVLEAAATPQQPWRPLYLRDAAIAASGSLILALLAMWLVELFNRMEPTPSLVIAQPIAGGLAFHPAGSPLLRQQAPVALDAAAPNMLPQPAVLPRELAVDEVTALLHGADDDTRLALQLLLCGLDADEVMRLGWGDVDLDQRAVRVSGDSARVVPLADTVARSLASRRPPTAENLVLNREGGALARGDLDAQILCAAHDAGLQRPAEVTAESVRHTYIAWLVRAGIRFADLMRIVGRLPAEVLGAYSTLAPPGEKMEVGTLDQSYPTLRPSADAKT